MITYDPSGDDWTHDDQQQFGEAPSWWLGFPAIVALAHEIEHGYQDAMGELVGYGRDIGNRVGAVAEQKAMQAENAMAYAFYKKVPGYGKGGAHEIAGPRTYYNRAQRSLLTGELYDVKKAMTWDEWSPCFTPAY